MGSVTGALAVGDYNADGNQDVAVNIYDTNGMRPLFGNGTGGAFASGQTKGAGTAPISVAAGDVNGDGNLDVAVANRNDGAVSVYFGNGNGTFQNQVRISTGLQYSVEIADLNNDGVGDLVTRLVGGTLNVQLGRTSGAFQFNGNYSTGADA